MVTRSDFLKDCGGGGRQRQGLHQASCNHVFAPPCSTAVALFIYLSSNFLFIHLTNFQIIIKNIWLKLKGHQIIKNGKSMFLKVNLKINGKWVQRVGIRVVSTFDQKIFVFRNQRIILPNNTKTTNLLR